MHGLRIEGEYLKKLKMIALKENKTATKLLGEIVEEWLDEYGTI